MLTRPGNSEAEVDAEAKRKLWG